MIAATVRALVDILQQDLVSSKGQKFPKNSWVQEKYLILMIV